MSLITDRFYFFSDKSGNLYIYTKHSSLFRNKYHLLFTLWIAIKFIYLRMFCSQKKNFSPLISFSNIFDADQSFVSWNTSYVSLCNFFFRQQSVITHQKRNTNSTHSKRYSASLIISFFFQAKYVRARTRVREWRLHHAIVTQSSKKLSHAPFTVGQQGGQSMYLSISSVVYMLFPSVKLFR